MERIRLSHDSKFLASCSHDNTIKFWNVDYLFQEDIAENAEESGEPTPTNNSMEMDDSDDSDREQDSRSKKRTRVEKPKKVAQTNASEKSSEFFADL